MDSIDATFGGWRACDGCGEAGLRAPGEGLLSVSVEQLVQRRADVREREEAEARGEPAGPAPGLVPWDWGHRDCFPDRQPPYAIRGDRLDTLPEMMARTLQLLDEDWFLETAWEDAVRRFYAIPFE